MCLLHSQSSPYNESSCGIEDIVVRPVTRAFIPNAHMRISKRISANDTLAVGDVEADDEYHFGLSGNGSVGVTTDETFVMHEVHNAIVLFVWVASPGYGQQYLVGAKFTDSPEDESIIEQAILEANQMGVPVLAYIQSVGRWGQERCEYINALRNRLRTECRSLSFISVKYSLDQVPQAFMAQQSTFTVRRFVENPIGQLT